MKGIKRRERKKKERTEGWWWRKMATMSKKGMKWKQKLWRGDGINYLWNAMLYIACTVFSYWYHKKTYDFLAAFKLLFRTIPCYSRFFLCFSLKIRNFFHANPTSIFEYHFSTRFYLLSLPLSYLISLIFRLFITSPTHSS